MRSLGVRRWTEPAPRMGRGPRTSSETVRRIDTTDGGSGAGERFQAAYDAYAPDVAAYALRRRGAVDAADVVAETFVSAWRRRQEMPEEPATRAWLLGVARRIIAAQAKGERREAELAERLAEQFGQRYGAVAPIERLEQISIIGAAIERLSENDRELLLLVAWEQLQPAEIGALLGLPGPVVRKRLERARKRLRRHLADLDGAWQDPSSDRSRSSIGLRPNPGAAR